MPAPSRKIQSITKNRNVNVSSFVSVLTVVLGVLGVLGELLVGVRLRSDARDRNGEEIADRTPDRGDGLKFAVSLIQLSSINFCWQPTYALQNLFWFVSEILCIT